jgi:hypothetical protein
LAPLQPKGWWSRATSPSSRCRPTRRSLRGSAPQPVERVWLFLRERHLSHRLLNTYDAVVAGLCRAWNALTSYPYLDQVKI